MTANALAEEARLVSVIKAAKRGEPRFSATFKYWLDRPSPSACSFRSQDNRQPGEAAARRRSRRSRCHRRRQRCRRARRVGSAALMEQAAEGGSTAYTDEQRPSSANSLMGRLAPSNIVKVDERAGRPRRPARA